MLPGLDPVVRLDRRRRWPILGDDGKVESMEGRSATGLAVGTGSATGIRAPGSALVTTD
jgi:hypothetical protein